MAAAVLQGSAAASATVAYQAATSCPDSYGPVSKATAATVCAPAVIDTVRRHYAAHGFSAPVAAQYTPSPAPSSHRV